MYIPSPRKAGLSLLPILATAILVTSCQKKPSEEASASDTKPAPDSEQVERPKSPAIPAPEPVELPVQTTLVSVKKAGSKALLSVDVKNQHAQPIRSYKGMILLLDHKGELVGVKNRWLIGGSSSGEKSETLENDKTQTVKLVIDHDRPYTSIEIIPTRIVLADGTAVTPVKTKWAV